MSLLLDALRRAEKAKDATLSTEAADTEAIPLLVEQVPPPRSDGQDFSLAEMVDGAEQPVLPSEIRVHRNEDGYGSPSPENRSRRDAEMGGTAGAMQSGLSTGRVEARSLFDLNGEPAVRRRWRWAFIGTGITLIVLLSGYYGWLLYIAAKPRAGLVARHVAPAVAKPVVSQPPMSSGSVDDGTAGVADAPVSAGASPKLVPIPEGGPAAGAQLATRGGGEKPVSGASGGRPAAKQSPSPGSRDVRRAELAPESRGPVGDGMAVAVEERPEARERGPSVITISRRQRKDPIFLRLTSAYEAYRAGDYAQAEADYRFVLDRQPDNRDALLGIAALALSNGRLDEAYGLYRRVLANSPGDQAALAALTALQEQGDPLKSEHRLRQLLAADPEAPYLHFALGNLFAERGQWSEAQQAYFEAYRRDRDNGDYVFNLAVGLDHLGQRRAASRYYRRALEVAGQGAAGFDPDIARRRVRTLSERPGASEP